VSVNKQLANFRNYFSLLYCLYQGKGYRNLRV